MKKTLIVFGLVFFCQLAVAQNENDVLRYSTTDIFGSARFEAMAGSFGALGADFSAIQINPASMGRFSSSQATVSFNSSFLQNDAVFNNTQTSSRDNKFALSALGVVLTRDVSQTNKGKRYSQLTLGYTRLKNFANYRKYEGDEYHSLLDVFANAGAGIPEADIFNARPFTTGLAYDVFALDYDPGSMLYIPRLTTTGDMHHVREITTTGGIGEYHIGYSENFRNKLYYGASVGIRRIKYEEYIDHTETLQDTVGVSLRSFNYTHNLKTKGTGVNIKLGVIYLPTEQFRMGLSFESPTLFAMEDEWSADMSAMHDTGENAVLEENIPHGKFNYRLKTPMKLRASFAYVFGMRGAINVDLEMARLPGGKLKPATNYNSGAGFAENNSYLFDTENDQVDQQFRTVLNTRVGVEYMIFKGLFLRGGFALLPQPYEKDMGRVETPNTTYAAGIGWEYKFLQIDLSYRLVYSTNDYYAFDPSQPANRTQFKTKTHNIVLTAGFKF